MAVAEIGAVLLPVHLSYGERETLSLLERVQARAIVRPAAYRGVEGEALGRRMLAELEPLQDVLLVEDGAGGPARDFAVAANGTATGTGVHSRTSFAGTTAWSPGQKW